MGTDMALLDLNRVKQPVQMVKRRDDCHTYEGAYAYFKERVAEMDAKGDEAFTWVKKDSVGDLVVTVNLHSMPLYWTYEEAVPSEMIEIKDADLNVIDTRPKMIGSSLYKVDSFQEGVALLKALAAEEDEDFKVILTRGAEGLKRQDTVELPAVEQRAKKLYADWLNTPKGKESGYGAWDHKDGVSATTGAAIESKTKAAKKNSLKQTARSQMGYERAKIKVEMTSSAL